MNYILSVILILSFFPFWTVPEQNKKDWFDVQKSLRSALQTLLGSPKTLKVFVWNKEGRVQGDDDPIDRIIITVQGGQISDLPINWGRFVFSDVNLNISKLTNSGSLELLGASNASLDVQIRERDINAFLAARTAASNVKKATVHLKPDCITITGHCKWWFIDSQFEVKGKFVIHEGWEIHFEPSLIKLSSLNMPSFIVRQVMDRLNPVLTRYDLPFNVDLRKIQVSHSKLYLSSTR